MPTMKLIITIIFVAGLLLIPSGANATNEWCEIPYNMTEPECLNMPEPEIPVVSPPCSSDFEWACREFQLFLPGIGA